MTTKNYDSNGIQENITYLTSHPELKVILLLYDDKSPKYKDTLCKLFKNSIENIFLDDACWAEILDLKTLYEILVEGGIYKLDMKKELIKKWANKFSKDIEKYIDYVKFFTIDLDKGIIIKNNTNTIIYSKRTSHEDINKIIKTAMETQSMERPRLDKLESQWRDNLKEKRMNCTLDTDCNLLGKNGECIDNVCVFDSVGESYGGKQ